MTFTLFQEFSELSPIQLAMFIALSIFAIAAIVYMAKRKGAQKNHSRFDTQALTYAAICISLSFALSYFRLFKMPQGGSITIGSMLPIFIYAHYFGLKRGLTAAFAYSILQFIQDPYILSIPQVLTDYALAFTSLGLAGLFPKRLSLGILTGGLSRLFFHAVSGVIFFGEFVPEGMNAWVYSLGYNLSVVGPDLVICLILAGVLKTSGFMGKLRTLTNTKIEATKLETAT